MLNIDNLRVKAENLDIIESLSLEIEEGEAMFLFGPNGSGKSTLIRAIAGLNGMNTEGKIEFNGKDITNLPINERVDIGIATSFQMPPEIVGVKLKDILKICLEKAANTDFSEEEYKLIEEFKLVDFLDRDINVDFSGGEKKRAEILQLLFLKPKLMLIDEPDSGVDMETIQFIGKKIDNYLKETNSSALIVTHQGAILENIEAKKACVLLKKQIYCLNDPQKIFEHIRKQGYEGCLTCEERK